MIPKCSLADVKARFIEWRIHDPSARQFMLDYHNLNTEQWPSEHTYRNLNYRAKNDFAPYNIEFVTGHYEPSIGKGIIYINPVTPQAKWLEGALYWESEGDGEGNVRIKMRYAAEPTDIMPSNSDMTIIETAEDLFEGSDARKRQVRKLKRLARRDRIMRFAIAAEHAIECQADQLDKLKTTLTKCGLTYTGDADITVRLDLLF